MPGCPLYASEDAVARLVAPVTAQRMRQLRALKPVRAADGRRMYCVAERCYEQLPPPPPPQQQEQGDGGAADEDGEPPRASAEGAEGEDEPAESPVSFCPECGQGACLKCGGAAHAGRTCGKPDEPERHMKMYAEYAVGRVAACPWCGIHVEVEGDSCRNVVCIKCRRGFEFRPFQTADEAGEDVLGRQEGLGVGGENVAHWPELSLARCAFMMVYGCAFCIAPLSYVVSMIASGKIDWLILFFLPFICFGVPVFVGGWVSFVVAAWRARLAIGRPGVGDWVQAAQRVLGGVVLGLGGRRLAGLLDQSEDATWAWLFFTMPFYCCSGLLLLLAGAHAGAVLASRLLEFGRRGNAGDGNVGDVGEGDAEMEVLVDEARRVGAENV